MKHDTSSTAPSCTRRRAISRLSLATSVALCGRWSIPAEASRRRAYVAVDRHVAAAYPGETVRIPIRLMVQDGNARPAPVAGATLQVRTSRVAMSAETPVRLRDLVTASDGRAIIAFRMPTKLRSKAGREVSTKVVVDVYFQGIGGIPPANANRAIQIKIRP